VNIPKDVYFGIWYFIYIYFYFFIWYFIYFRLVDIELLIVTKYYLSQQSQHQHFLTSWWFSRIQRSSLGNIDLGWRKKEE
jgi:hypothetical protein